MEKQLNSNYMEKKKNPLVPSPTFISFMNSFFFCQAEHLNALCALWIPLTSSLLIKILIITRASKMYDQRKARP